MHPVWLGKNSEPVKARRNFGLMGILNLTPDSFYDGGSFTAPAKALAKASQLLEQGADIVDMGAESTRPGSYFISAQEEQARLLPVLKSFHEAFPHAQASVDSWRAETAAASLEAGADIINDISGTHWDPGLPEVLAQFRPAYILMHNNERPEKMHFTEPASDIMQRLLKFFEERLNFLVKTGLPEEHIALDPGIGFGKTPVQNLEILKNLRELLIFNRPVVLGVSMKSLFSKLLGCSLEDRLLPTAITSALSFQKGIFWHRVHHPREIGAALTIAKLLQN